jgi:hypothetical protein
MSCSWVLYVERKRAMMDLFLPPVLVNVVMDYLMDDAEEPSAPQDGRSILCKNHIIRCCELSVHMLFLRVDRTETFFVKQIADSLNLLQNSCLSHIAYSY